MERACLDVLAQTQSQQPLAHLARGLPRERECERVAGLGRFGGDAIRDPSRQDPGLARSGPGDHRDQVRLGGDRGALVGVEIGNERLRIHPATVGRPRPPRRPALRCSAMSERTDSRTVRSSRAEPGPTR